MFETHVCALFWNGRARCWGLNENEQLGDRTLIDRGSDSTSSLTGALFVSFAASINTYRLQSVSAGGYGTN